MTELASKESTGLQEKTDSGTSISRREAKQQFDFLTDLLKLKHTFSFDEMYDGMMEFRREKEFRNDITSFEKKMREIPGCSGPDPFPLVHTFSDGLYIRQVTVPPKTLTVTKIHKQEHAFFLMKGTISILTEEGVKKFTAPYQGITKVGTKRVIYHHDEVIFTTVHATEEKDVSSVEKQVIANNFDEVDALEGPEIQQFIDVVAKEEKCLS
jgi:hypothetical protein